MDKHNNNLLGVILVLTGISILLLNTNVLPREILLVLIGVAFLVGYYRGRNLGNLVIGTILSIVGIGTVLDEFGFASVDLSGFFFILSLGIAFLILYFAKNIKGFLYPGCILPVIGVFSLLDEIYDSDIGWALFLLLAVSFILIYLIEYRQTGNSWPLIPAVVLLVISVLFFFASEDIVKYEFWRVLSYIWPTIIIIAGVRIIYNNYRHKNY
jgi:hypothetical protein